MMNVKFFLFIHLVFGLSACNFDGPDTRKVCAEDCDDEGAVEIGSGASVAQIDLLNRRDGNKGCPIDFNQQTFDMTDYSGTSAQAFTDAQALESYLKQNTGFTWTYDSATCLLSSTDEGAASNTIEIPFFENSLAGKVFTDVDPTDGDFSSNDAGIGGVGITLTCGSYVAQTTTNAAGEYRFENIPPGACTVSTDEATRPANHNHSYDEDGNRDHSIPVTVGPSTNTVDHNFGYIPTFANSLSGVVFRDAQNDKGDLEGADVGIPGVTVNLVCGAQSFSTTTDANGAYSFADLPPGSCVIRVDGGTIPSGLTHSYDEDLSIDEVYTLSVGNTGAHPGNDFGYVPAVVATINFVNEEDGSTASCGLDFTGRTFDMMSFGGAADATYPDVAALEAAIESAPGGYLWVYDGSTCLFSSVSVGAADSTIPLKKQICSSAPALVFNVNPWQVLTVTSSSSTNFVAKVINLTSIMSDSGTTPADTVHGVYAEGSFSSLATLNVGDPIGANNAPLPAGEYKIQYVDDSCSYDFTIELESILPYVYADPGKAFNVCAQNSVAVNDIGSAEIKSTPEIMSTSSFEQTIQYSSDGSTWMDPSAFQTGATPWWAATSGAISVKDFAVVVQPGDLIRNCLSVLGTSTLVKCDLKIIPDPQISLDRAGGSIQFSNAAVENNVCYQASNDEYQLTIRAYDSVGKLVEEHTPPFFKPATQSIDLSGAGVEITAMVTVDGANNYQLNYNPTAGAAAQSVEAFLQVKHVYDCVGTNRDTSLVWSKDTYEYTVDKSGALVDYSSLKIDDAAIKPPSTDYNFQVYSDSGTPVINFGAGTSYANVAGTFPANSGSTYPLLGGVYYPAIETAGTYKPLAPMCIDAWNICERKVQLNYQGLTSGSKVEYELPLESAQVSLDTIFESMSVPDQLKLIDCAGVEFYDSGQVSTNGRPVTTNHPLGLPVDTSCGKVKVETTPDPARPMEVTIYEVSVGCCKGGSCDLPERHPYVDSTRVEACTSRNTILTPYYSALHGESKRSNPAGQLCQRENLNKIGPSACINQEANVVGRQFLFGNGVGNAFHKGTPCLDLGLRTFRTVSKAGNIVTAEFSDAASYAMGKNFFETINDLVQSVYDDPTRLPTEEVCSVFTFPPGKDVLCGDDGSNVSRFTNKQINSSIVSYDDILRTITINTELHDFSGTATDDCLKCDPYDASVNAQNWFNTLDSDLASWKTNIYVGKRNVDFKSGSVLTEDASFKYFEFDYGVDVSSCVHNNPVQKYTFKVNKSDASQWQLFLGDKSSSDLLQDSSLHGYIAGDGSTIQKTQDNDWGDRCYSDSASVAIFKNRNYINITRQDGWVLSMVPWATTKCDLSYYGGSAGEGFTDITQLAMRMTALTGLPWLAQEAQTQSLIYNISEPVTWNYFPIVCQ